MINTCLRVCFCVCVCACVCVHVCAHVCACVRMCKEDASIVCLTNLFFTCVIVSFGPKKLMIDFLTVFLSTLFYKQKQPSTDAVIKWCKNRLQIAAKPKKQRRDQQTVGPTRWLIEGIGASLMNVRRWWWGFILKKYKMARNKTRLPGYQVVHMITRHNIAWYRSKPYENAIHRVQNKCLKKNKQKTSIIRYEKCFFQMHRCTVKPSFFIKGMPKSAFMHFWCMFWRKKLNISSFLDKQMRW